jgi:hypothetical protein|tara:strand:+ start:906 stop:1091 length:186 start_codon:yes stop_codon:yes gene_type:complete
MEQRTLKPLDQDYAILWQINPMAKEQLASIVLRRLLEEAEAELGKGDAQEKITTIQEATGD